MYFIISYVTVKLLNLSEFKPLINDAMFFCKTTRFSLQIQTNQIFVVDSINKSFAEGLRL